MKKVIGIVCILAMLLAVLSGCSNAADTPAETEKAETIQETTETGEATEEAVFGAQPEGYPKKNITMIVPANAGTNIDLVARDIAENIDLGSEIIIENVGGAGQSIGTAQAAREKGDGYTLLAVSPVGLLTKPIQLGLDYSWDSFRYIGPVEGRPRQGILAAEKSGYTSWDQIVEAAKAGEDITWTTGNAGSIAHLMMIGIQEYFDIELSFVPYNGSAEVYAALEGGHVDLGLVILETNTQRIEAGTLIPVLTAAGDRDTSDLNLGDVPDALDYGMESIKDFGGYNILVMPADTPDDIYNYIKAKADELFTSEEYIGRRTAGGFGAPEILTEQEMNDIHKGYYELYQRICEDIGLVPEK